MTNLYTSPAESRETFTEYQVSEINDAISKAVEEEMCRQYSALNAKTR